MACRFGTYSVDQAISAGLDLEMPGPPRWRTPLLVNHSLGAQKISVEDIDARVTAILSLVQKLAKKNPEVVFGDGVERSRDSPEARQFCRKLTAETMVLLKNKSGLLPLHVDKAKKIAIIGPHAKASVISGGGSAALKPTYVVTPWDGITKAAPEGFSMRYAVGTYGQHLRIFEFFSYLTIFSIADRYLPTLENMMKTDTGKPGWTCTFHTLDENDEPLDVASYDLTETKVKLNDFLPPGLGDEWGIRLRGYITVDHDMSFELGLAVAGSLFSFFQSLNIQLTISIIKGRAKLYVDGMLAIDNWTKQRPGDFFYGYASRLICIVASAHIIIDSQGTAEEKAVVKLKAGRPVEIGVDYLNTSPPPGPNDDLAKRISQPALMRGLVRGTFQKILKPQILIA